MEKWVFVNNIINFDKLYYLTKAVKEEVVTVLNHEQVLLEVLNRNGANRNEANSHPLKYILFYRMVELVDGRYVPTLVGDYLINHYNELLEDKVKRAKFFFMVSLKISYPNEAVETSNNYCVNPFIIIFKLLFDERLEKRVTISELTRFLSVVHTDDDYEHLVQLIIDDRNGTDDINANVLEDLEEVMQLPKIVSGWCNQFSLMKKEGEYIMVSDELEINLPKICNFRINVCPYNNHFISFVLYQYLFNGMSFANIENNYHHVNDKKGFLVKDILDFFRINDDSNKGMYNNEDLRFVGNYLKLQSNDIYKKLGIALLEEGVLESRSFDNTDINTERLTGGYSMIYYGAPGCGKSYLVNKKYCKNEENVVRTVFHTEYSNSDFVGQIIPKTKEDGSVYYDFQEGPFTKALYKAFDKPKEMVCLIIDELNRGKAADIFGEIFQLLDRDDDGTSKYKIDNYNIVKFLRDKGINIDSVYLPSNLWIIATMNTSDQNVMPLDTAFKRRWKQNFIENKFDDDNLLKDLLVPGSKYTWKEFVTTINNAILERNPAGLNSEDKQIGVYFVSKAELALENDTDISKKEEYFAEKVLMYIYNDIAKLEPGMWFNRNIRCFSELLNEFKRKHLGVFKNLFEDEIETEDLIDE